MNIQFYTGERGREFDRRGERVPEFYGRREERMVERGRFTKNK